MDAKEIMRNVISIESKKSIKDAAKIMSKKNIGSLVVHDKDKLVGIITEKDIIKNLDKSSSSKISTIMSKKVITLDEDDSIDEIARVMTKCNVKRIPIKNGKKLVGIITATDILANSDYLNEPFFFG